jgi:hypothetical protein
MMERREYARCFGELTLAENAARKAQTELVEHWESLRDFANKGHPRQSNNNYAAAHKLLDTLEELEYQRRIAETSALTYRETLKGVEVPA